VALVIHHFRKHSSVGSRLNTDVYIIYRKYVVPIYLLVKTDAELT